jgi:hypothetical protein
MSDRTGIGAAGLRIDRRALLAVAGGLACTAWRAEPDPDALFFSEARYVPLWKRHAESAAAEPGMDQLAIQFYAMLGDERRAFMPSIEEPPADLADCVAVDALDAIAEAAQDRRVVILNEAHNVSGHRAFAARVLRRLRPLGFDWYAAETFTPGPSPTPASTWKAGAPITPKVGWYLMDPVFAELLREAADLGFRFIEYEHDTEKRPVPPRATGLERIEIREEAQADNLADFLLRNPEARVVVHCGYSHAAEVPIGPASTEWFAARLKRKTGLDPLTIDQSSSWPGPDPALEDAVSRAVRERFGAREPVVLRKPGGGWLTFGGYVGAMDMAVFHPRWEDRNGRPGWLAADPRRRAAPVRLQARSDAYRLLQAVPLNEPDATAPADQLPLAAGQDRATLYLAPGAYRVRIETLAGYEPLGDLHVS